MNCILHGPPGVIRGSLGGNERANGAMSRHQLPIGDIRLNAQAWMTQSLADLTMSALIVFSGSWQVALTQRVPVCDIVTIFSDYDTVFKLMIMILFDGYRI